MSNFQILYQTCSKIFRYAQFGCLLTLSQSLVLCVLFVAPTFGTDGLCPECLLLPKSTQLSSQMTGNMKVWILANLILCQMKFYNGKYRLDNGNTFRVNPNKHVKIVLGMIMCKEELFRVSTV